jgi:hypothetical protein
MSEVNQEAVDDAEAQDVPRFTLTSGPARQTIDRTAFLRSMSTHHCDATVTYRILGGSRG